MSSNQYTMKRYNAISIRLKGTKKKVYVFLLKNPWGLPLINLGRSKKRNVYKIQFRDTIGHVQCRVFRVERIWSIPVTSPPVVSLIVTLDCQRTTYVTPIHRLGNPNYLNAIEPKQHIHFEWLLALHDLHLHKRAPKSCAHAQLFIVVRHDVQ